MPNLEVVKDVKFFNFLKNEIVWVIGRGQYTSLLFSLAGSV